MQPRRKQPPITIRSERALKRLRILTSGGRSQAEVIEEALDRMPEPVQNAIEQRRAEIEAILDRVDRTTIMSMKEFDALEYDEAGMPR